MHVHPTDPIVVLDLFKLDQAEALRRAGRDQLLREARPSRDRILRGIAVQVGDGLVSAGTRLKEWAARGVAAGSPGPAPMLQPARAQGTRPR